jgi:DNA-binding CsgD family transcriptional regulator
MNPNDPTDRTNPSEPTDTPADAQHLAPSTQHSDTWDCKLCGLTSQQVNLLQLTALGHTRAEIISRQGVDAATLKRELTVAQRRLGARSKLHAVAKAIRGGWIS